jgi:hypothetical protein
MLSANITLVLCCRVMFSAALAHTTRHTARVPPPRAHTTGLASHHAASCRTQQASPGTHQDCPSGPLRPCTWAIPPSRRRREAVQQPTAAANKLLMVPGREAAAAHKLLMVPGREAAAAHKLLMVPGREAAAAHSSPQAANGTRKGGSSSPQAANGTQKGGSAAAYKLLIVPGREAAQQPRSGPGHGIPDSATWLASRSKVFFLFLHR